MSPDTGDNTQWWKDVYFDKSRKISQDMLSDAVWFMLLNIAKRRLNFAKKFSARNTNPVRHDRLVLGELQGLRRLASDLSSAGVIRQSPESVQSLDEVIAEHEERCIAVYEVFP